MRRPDGHDGQLDAGLAERSRAGRRLRCVTGVDDVAGQQNLGRVLADVGAVLVQHVLCAGELLDGAADEVPVLSEARGCAQRALLAAAADAERRVRSLHRLGLAPGISQLVIAAAEGRDVLRQQPEYHLAGLFEPVAPLARRAKLDAVCSRLLLVPAS